MFLVAAPGLNDPNFARTVVLISQHDQGAIGLVINRPSEVRLSELFSNNAALRDNLALVYFGGPVALGTMAVLLHGEARPEDALQIFDGVYVSQDLGAVNKLLGDKLTPEKMRLFVGYAGWAPGQLEAEIELGGWYLMPAAAEFIFADDPEKVWPELIRRAGGRSVRAPGAAYGLTVQLR